MDQNNQLMREIMPATDRITWGDVVLCLEVIGGLVYSSILRE